MTKPTLERRDFTITEAKIETRAKGDDNATEQRFLEGYASVFNSDSEDLGGFREQIAPGAFTRSLKSVSDGDLVVHALWSHDWSQPLGSTRSGKLTLEEDDTGLRFKLDVTRMTPAQLDAAMDGDVRMSFGFRVLEQTWEETADQVNRTISDLDLFEVSPVIMPAYPDTSAAIRSLDAWKAERAAPTETEVDPSERINLKLRVLERKTSRK